MGGIILAIVGLILMYVLVKVLLAVAIGLFIKIAFIALVIGVIYLVIKAMTRQKSVL